MAKKSFRMNQRRNLAIIIAIAVAFVLLGAAVSQMIQSAPIDSNSGVPAEGSIQVEGTTLCLPHRDTSGPQTAECAIGLEDDSGRYFALGDSDPQYGNIIKTPMNTRVRVDGTFRVVADKKYPTVGTITVTKITNL